MDEALRYEVDRQEPAPDSFLDFSDSQGILRAAEKCNGSGDCRKSAESAGAMCPSYQATKEEKDSTRARANALREYLTQQEADGEDLKEVLDLCISCKACARECPSNVDMAALKSEVQFQYQESKGYSLRSKAFAYSTTLNKWASRFAGLSNALYSNRFTSAVIKGVNGIAQERSLPLVHRENFKAQLQALRQKHPLEQGAPQVVLYIDEFTRYMDTSIGKDALILLHRLGYHIELIQGESGRTFLSKGFLKQAKKCAEANLELVKPYLGKEIPVLGIEPSAILSFRDEYRRFGLNKTAVNQLASQSQLIEEFLAAEWAKGRITADQFTGAEKEVQLHVHCHQKALSNSKVSCDVLGIPKNYRVRLMPTGCCGMAGSFGYEKEHYQVSMQIGELKLFPRVRKLAPEVLIAANGTSCRHQIADGTGRHGEHPIQILRKALI
jgi:Fe-S oxidoreductase